MKTSGVAKWAYLLLGIAVLPPAGALAQSVDVSWTFGNVDMSAYRLDAYQPAGIEFAPVGTENPTLPLRLGGRYEVKVTNYSFHPLEIVALGTFASQDRVVLSMASQGTLESDPSVAWEDNKQGTVRFTLSAGLYQALTEGGRKPGYRCQPHASTRWQETMSREHENAVPRKSRHHRARRRRVCCPAGRDCPSRRTVGASLLVG